ncbi:hypothetical protein BKA63DRAFT_252096 [Paraphoma chrysanthemicola]|nr:hypothetical protein BKA63DRAFT_252096 [Paraphoma chrysanthemicola]
MFFPCPESVQSMMDGCISCKEHLILEHSIHSIRNRVVLYLPYTMHFALVTGLLLTLATRVICSPLHTSAASSVAALEPTCTLNVLRAPSFDVDCTFKQHTKTATAYTDCGGCALQTRALGVGLVSFAFPCAWTNTEARQPCRSVTTTPGVATVTVTACQKSRSKPSITATPAATPYQ